MKSKESRDEPVLTESQIEELELFKKAIGIGLFVNVDQDAGEDPDYGFDDV